MSKERRPILAKGEEYIQRHDKTQIGGPKVDTRLPFDEARIRLSTEIDSALKTMNDIPDEYLLDNVIINMKMHVDYSAKSYYPEPLIRKLNAVGVGTKKWTKKVTNKRKPQELITKIGTEIFIQVNRSNLINLKSRLDDSDTTFKKNEVEDIRSIEKLYYDDHSSLINNFDGWDEGRIEIVLHQQVANSANTFDEIVKLMRKHNIDVDKIKYKTYNSGVTFISASANIESVRELIKFNPIRTARPLVFREFPITRLVDSGKKLPLPPLSNEKSSITVGVFDGGVDSSNPYFRNFVSEHNPIPTMKEEGDVMHGSGVISAILYGNLAKYKTSSALPTPIVNVESFRVLPLSDKYDHDLYEIIDIIEDIVPKRPDIDVFNLSLGPAGAIDDDYISRFTYAIDELSKTGKCLFAVAVGNEGDLPLRELCRIQPPSDSVNCLGVGAYSKDYDGSIDRADYSSYGDGREGCKIKPDFLDFGGCEITPFQMISSGDINRYYSAGTSFATPLVAAKAAEIIGRSNYGSPLIARTLLVHSAKHPQNDADCYMGYGIASDNVDEILSCEDGSVTTLFEGKIAPSKYIKLPLPYVKIPGFNGKVEITYTIAMATEVDASKTEDYTLSCIEDTFYPHDEKYKITFKQNGKTTTKTVNIVNDQELISEYEEAGWKISGQPIISSEYSNKYKTETERKENFKWDTILKRSRKKRNSSLKNPYLVLHAMERFNSNVDFVYYAVAVTLKYINCEEDVYDITLKSYNRLEPTLIKNRNEILVK